MEVDNKAENDESFEYDNDSDKVEEGEEEGQNTEAPVSEIRTAMMKIKKLQPRKIKVKRLTMNRARRKVSRRP